MKICLFGTYNFKYSRNTSIRDGLKIVGVKVIEVHEEVPITQLETSEDFNIRQSLIRIWRKIKASFVLLGRYKELLSCDVIIVLHPGHLDLPIAWLLCKLGKKKLVFDTSISPYDMLIVARSIADKNSLKAKLLKLGEGFLLRLPDKLFTDTKLMKDFIVKEFKIDSKKIFVVPLGANNRVYKPKAKRKTNNKTNVFFFGMYNPVHGARHILHAIKLLRNEKNLEFTLLGDGPLKKELVDYAQEKKLKNVEFLGFVPEKKLVEHIQDCDIMLGVFSNSKIIQRVIPNKIFAGIACKKPLISAKQPAMQRTFKHKKHIYYCKPEDPKSLANAIKALAANKNLQQTLAINGYKVYLNNFTPTQIGKTLSIELGIGINE